MIVRRRPHPAPGHPQSAPPCSKPRQITTSLLCSRFSSDVARRPVASRPGLFPLGFASPMCKSSNGCIVTAHDPMRSVNTDSREFREMSLRMPEPDAAILGRRERIVAMLRTIVPGEGVIATERELRPYESDGLTAYRQLPMVVVLPETTDQVAQILRFCHAEGIKVVPRGAGTSLSGGALPLADGVLLGMAKFNRIREVDFKNRVAVVEPGVTNLAVSNAVAY